MADEWWSSARTEDAASACSTIPGTDQDSPESSSAARRSSTSADYFRPSLHVDAAATSPPPSFLAGDPPHMDWAQPAYMGGGRAGAAFNAVLQLHGGDSGSHFLLDQQPDVVDGVAALVAPSAASLYADNHYSSYGGDVAAPPMAKPFSQQELSGFFASSTRDFSDVASVLQPMKTKPLLLQALEHKAFESHKEPVEDACSSATRSGVSDSSPPAKKPRIVATPSSMPTFKVRKEKLGDRITALQQLVSPFGKTDTASVLHEAVEYIRFLHDQVASLSSPYLKCGRLVQQLQHKQDVGESKEDLRSRGLCLVPVASTYAVASETAPEFWHPTFGGTFR